MSILRQSTDRLNQGKEALARGDVKQALKEFSVSISLAPSVEAYLLRAEANYCSGDIETALADLDKAQDICDSSGGGSDWETEIEQARNRYEGARAESYSGPPVDQTISVLLPTAISGGGEVVSRIASRPEFSTDGSTLFRKDGTVIYDLQICERNDDWANNVIEMRAPASLGRNVEKIIREHSGFVHLQAPNWEIAQATDSQVSLAIELLQTLEPLMRALKSPVSLLRTANRVHTREEIQQLVENLSAETLVNAFARLYDADNEMFSAGMQALGFADVEIPYDVVPAESAADIAEEFLIFELIGGDVDDEEEMEFSSAVSGLTYQLVLSNCDRFDTAGEARFNPYGVWVFTA